MMNMLHAQTDPHLLENMSQSSTLFSRSPCCKTGAQEEHALTACNAKERAQTQTNADFRLSEKTRANVDKREHAKSKHPLLHTLLRQPKRKSETFERGEFLTAVRGTMCVSNGAVAPGPSRKCDINFFVNGRPKSKQQLRDSAVRRAGRRSSPYRHPGDTGMSFPGERPPP